MYTGRQLSQDWKFLEQQRYFSTVAIGIGSESYNQVVRLPLPGEYRVKLVYDVAGRGFFAM